MLETLNVRHLFAVTALFVCVPMAANAESQAADRWPQLVGAEYTYVRQHQSALHSPYAGALSLDPDGDTEPSHTIGAYVGWAPLERLQLYFDTEKFMGAGVSGATGLGGLPNGEVVREGAGGLHKTFYIARLYARVFVPLSDDLAPVQRTQDQIPDAEPQTRLEFKAGRLAVSDDFDRNRYAGSTRTQFMNWSLWANTAWDYAANTRGYTDGIAAAYVSRSWSLRFGLYRMPEVANGQTLEHSLRRAREEDVELTFSPLASGPTVRLLAYRNLANMGDYREALASAALDRSVPNIVADNRQRRRKYGFAMNLEQPLADDGETGLFARIGWNDGATESFAFTEVDRHLSAGAQVSGVHWRRPDDRLGVAQVLEGLSAPHRRYLAAGGSGFVLGDGALDYGREKITEIYYRAQLASFYTNNVKLQFGPDFQYVRNPGYNHARGPVSFWALRAHVEY